MRYVTVAIACLLAVGLLGEKSLKQGAQAQSPFSWKATVQQISGNGSTCNSGWSTTVYVNNDNELYTYYSNRNYLFKVKLAADGSFDAVVPTEVSKNRGWRITIPAGTGPREFGIVTQTNACGYRVVPHS